MVLRHVIKRTRKCELGIRKSKMGSGKAETKLKSKVYWQRLFKLEFPNNKQIPMTEIQISKPVYDIKDITFQFFDHLILEFEIYL